MKPVKLVLFDLDDTLFDHRHCYRTGLEALIRDDPYFSRKSLEQLEDHYDRNLEDLHALVLQGLMTLEEARNERFRRLLVFCGGPDCLETGRAVAERFRALYLDARRPVPGALELLTALKPRVTIGVVTNNVTEEQKEKLLHCALHDLVDFMVTSEEVGEPKPGALIFRTALERGGAVADEAVMVGDSWASDVRGAVGAGIRAVWFNRHGRPNPDPSLAEELTDFEPVEPSLRTLLGPW